MPKTNLTCNMRMKYFISDPNNFKFSYLISIIQGTLPCVACLAPQNFLFRKFLGDSTQHNYYTDTVSLGMKYYHHYSVQVLHF